MGQRRTNSEQGAVFIHVAIGLLVLLGFTAFVADYGMLWVSRNQAQNSADAAALSGAAALAWDTDAVDRWDRARNVAWNTGIRNRVWGGEPGVAPVSPYYGAPCNARRPEACIRVDVFRNGTLGSSPLTTWFATLFGKNSQGTRASAVAETAPATGSKCMKPWLIPDRWSEVTAPTNTFDLPDDSYTRPTITEDGTINYGTGWNPLDIGTELTLKAGNPATAISPSDFYEIETATDYEEAIYGCRITKNIGDTVTALPGNRVGPTNSGVDTLLSAYPDGATVVIGMFDPSAFEAMRRQSGNFTLEIVNMLAFRIDHRNANQVVGTIVGAPSDMVTLCEDPVCPTSSGLIQVIRLVR
jgi:hypothetical protein